MKDERRHLSNLANMTDMDDHERKVVNEFCHLLEKSKQLFNGLRYVLEPCDGVPFIFYVLFLNDQIFSGFPKGSIFLTKLYK